MIKRALDIFGAAIGLIVFSPILIVIALMIRREMGSPVLFRQKRPGRHGKRFQMIKFRTMRDAIDADGRPLPDAERLTKLGRFLRSSSLDELPELWNVLKGEMSLVGPRPDTPMQEQNYSPEDWRRRHQVRPGITGLAQARLRSAATAEERLALDLEYVSSASLPRDLAILFETVRTVFIRKTV